MRSAAHFFSSDFGLKILLRVKEFTFATLQPELTNGPVDICCYSLWLMSPYLNASFDVYAGDL